MTAAALATLGEECFDVNRVFDCRLLIFMRASADCVCHIGRPSFRRSRTRVADNTTAFCRCCKLIMQLYLSLSSTAQGQKAYARQCLPMNRRLLVQTARPARNIPGHRRIVARSPWREISVARPTSCAAEMGRSDALRASPRKTKPCSVRRRYRWATVSPSRAQNTQTSPKRGSRSSVSTRTVSPWRKPAPIDVPSIGIQKSSASARFFRSRALASAACCSPTARR